jgi:hypothetical protein
MIPLFYYFPIFSLNKRGGFWGWIALLIGVGTVKKAYYESKWGYYTG